MNYSINHAMRDATGKWGNDLYQEWKDDLKVYYREKTEKILKSEKREG